MAGLTTAGAAPRDRDDSWRRFGAGEPAAFAELYRENHRDVDRYCRSLLHDEEDAEDAAQSTWAALWARPDAARRDVPLRPWLFRIAHNQAVDILRRRRPHDELSELDLAAPVDVADHVELRDRLAALRTDLINLPERQRGALLLRELCGLGHDEIGAVFQISAAAAKQTIYEARRALLDAEGGRSMACRAVQQAISDGDGRVRRGRRLRAHLRSCASCRDFANAVTSGSRELRLLFPGLPLPATAAHLLIGPGRAASGAGSGGLATVGAKLGASAAVKAAATVLVVAAGVGATHDLARAGRRATTDAAGRAVTAAGGGQTDDGRRAMGSVSQRSRTTTTPGQRTGGVQGGGADRRHGKTTSTVTQSSDKTRRPPASGRLDSPSMANPGQAWGDERSAGPPSSADASGESSSPGRSASAPGHSTTSSPGNSANAPGHSTTSPPGNSASAPGHSDTSSPGNSASAPGHSDTSSPGNSANAPGHSTPSPPGNSADAPGHGDPATPAADQTETPGNSANALGQSDAAAPGNSADAPAPAPGHGKTSVADDAGTSASPGQASPSSSAVHVGARTG
ncbi:MAG TPA: sigma-70 family RNA polymerase sigma factor [Baekduia sp.]